MKKLLSLILAATLLSSAPVLADKHLAGESLDVQFGEPLADEALLSFAERTGVQPVALEYEIGTIIGGCALRTDQTLHMALQDCREQHEAFLASIASSIHNAMEADETLRVETDAAELVQSFEQLAADYRNVSISRIRIRGDDAARLLREPEVQAVTPIRQRLADSDASGDAPRRRIEALAKKAWAPTAGQAEVTRYSTTATFYFSKLTDYDAKTTFAAETLISDSKFANWGGYWATNLPYAFVDAPLSDGPAGDSFKIGTAKGTAMRKNTSYFTYMSLYPQTAATATVTVRALKGDRKPQNCFLVWCVKHNAKAQLTTFPAPGGAKWK